MDVVERVGPSTLIVGEGGAHAITLKVTSVKEEGFTAIEICPAQFQSVEQHTLEGYYRDCYIDTL